MKRLALALALVAQPATAQDSVMWGSPGALPSTLRIGPTDAPGALAEVRFFNENRHISRHTGEVTWGGVTAGYDIRVDAGRSGPGGAADIVTITVPDGLIVVPPEAEVPEGGTQIFMIYPLASVGF